MKCKKKSHLKYRLWIVYFDCINYYEKATHSQELLSINILRLEGSEKGR